MGKVLRFARCNRRPVQTPAQAPGPSASQSRADEFGLSLERVPSERAEKASHFGECPECGKNDGYLNVRKCHFFVCHQHKTAWSVGWNLFSSWREETEKTWEENARLLEGYRVGEPRTKKGGNKKK